MLYFNIKQFKENVKLARKEVTVDNIVFRLHYRLMFWFMLACCVLVSSRQFIKEHINCIAEPRIARVINTFCFFSTTFTVVKHHNASQVMSYGAAHPGVGPFTPADSIVRHAYYQWVPFVLFFQSILFVAPHRIWKFVEKKKLEKMVHFVKTSALVAPVPTKIKDVDIDSVEGKSKKVMWLSSTYVTLTRLKVNREWAIQLILCESLNFVNLIAQIWFLQVFFQGHFLNLGCLWWAGDEDAFEFVFPKVTKCTFHRFGPSGTIQYHDAICVMPLNMINEKIYTLLWFCFSFLFLATVIGLIWRLLTFLLHSKSVPFNRFVWEEVSPGSPFERTDLVIITNHLGFSDWLFLYYLGKNMEPHLFRMLVAQVSHELTKQAKQSHILLDNFNGEDTYESESFC